MSERSTSRSFVCYLAALIIPAFTSSVWAMEDPAIGRWLTRDPLQYNPVVLEPRMGIARSGPATSDVDKGPALLMLLARGQQPAGPGQTNSPYSFAENNSMRSRDASGLCCCFDRSLTWDGICVTSTGLSCMCQDPEGASYHVDLAYGVGNCDRLTVPTITTEPPYVGTLVIFEGCKKTCLPIWLPALGLPFTNPVHPSDQCTCWGGYTVKTCCN
jgi:hypothetical protein